MRQVSPGAAQSQSMGIASLIRISYRKAVGNFAMLERRLISFHMEFVMLNFSFEFHTVLWDFDEQFFLC